MRVPVWGLFAIAMTLPVLPAAAQTYAPGYPVCLQAYTIDGEHIECAFASMAQCRASAAGRGASCVANPYYGGPARQTGASRRAK